MGVDRFKYGGGGSTGDETLARGRLNYWMATPIKSSRGGNPVGQQDPLIPPSGREPPMKPPSSTAKRLFADIEHITQVEHMDHPPIPQTTANQGGDGGGEREEPYRSWKSERIERWLTDQEGAMRRDGNSPGNLMHAVIEERRIQLLSSTGQLHHIGDQFRNTPQQIIQQHPPPPAGPLD